MPKTPTDYINSLVEGSICGIEEDLIRHIVEIRDNRNGKLCYHCGIPVRLEEYRIECKRLWLKQKAFGKNSEQRTEFIELCNSIKAKRMNELMERCIKLDKENEKNKRIINNLRVAFFENPTKEVDGETILLNNTE